MHPPSSPVREREREKEGERKRERVRVRKREGERKRERMRCERETDVELFLFLKGMTGALAPLSYLVLYNTMKFCKISYNFIIIL